MIHEVTITVLPGEELDAGLIKQKASDTLSGNHARCRADDIKHITVNKKSLDARHGRLKIHLRLTVYLNEEPPTANSIPAPRTFAPLKAGHGPVLIVGCGPAGLFAALRLLESGIKPVIVERGKRTPERKRDIAVIGRGGAVPRDSNYCFGEGGAGTFSDGKLYSRSNKRGNIRRVLETLCCFGADESILVDAHPHIGSDRLPAIISAMTDKICVLGGEVHFETRCTGFIVEHGKLRGIHTSAGILRSEALILAAGHSAPDIYRLLAETAPDVVEPKPFAVGVRVEHPRAVIDAIQYHGTSRFLETSRFLSAGKKQALPAAEYRLTAQVEGRGVYSFCMCPGGVIVPSASAPDEVVVNGMSSAGRNSRWSNAAIVVEVRPEDAEGNGGLSGLAFREELERTAYRKANAAANTTVDAIVPGSGAEGMDCGAKGMDCGGYRTFGQKAPAQRLIDFLGCRLSADLPPSSYTPGIVSSRLDEWLPPFIVRRLQLAFPEFEKKMRGFIGRDALLIAPETRTSTPVRITRNPETFESTVISGLFPAGEGSGYAGGIVSSALDGENVAGAVSERVNGSAGV
ncbi:NAD-utilizing dehydrogenase [Spirochaetia bacterium]|nr:NAD-utilizing dehydrogenase [Spirochaetia bacterium]